MTDRDEVLGRKLETIDQKLDALSASVDARFDAVDARFDAVDARFDAVDARFDAVDARFNEVTVSLVEQREYTEFAFDRLRGEMIAGFATVNANIGRLERKLDWLVDRLGPA